MVLLGSLGNATNVTANGATTAMVVPSKPSLSIRCRFITTFPAEGFSHLGRPMQIKNLSSFIEVPKSASL